MEYLGSLIMLIGILLLVWFWFDSLKAGDKAVQSAKNACSRMKIQLLDETVMLKGIGIRSFFYGLGFWRRYEFEFNDGTHARQQSYLILQGKTVIEVGFFNVPDKVVKFPSNRAASNDS